MIRCPDIFVTGTCPLRLWGTFLAPGIVHHAVKGNFLRREVVQESVRGSFLRSGFVQVRQKGMSFSAEVVRERHLPDQGRWRILLGYCSAVAESISLVQVSGYVICVKWGHQRN